MKWFFVILKRFPIHLIVMGILLGLAARFIFPLDAEDRQPKFDEPIQQIQGDATIDLPII